MIPKILNGLGICSVLDLSKAVIFPARKSVFSGNTLAIVTSLFPAVPVKRIGIRTTASYHPETQVVKIVGAVQRSKIVITQNAQAINMGHAGCLLSQGYPTCRPNIQAHYYFGNPSYHLSWFIISTTSMHSTTFTLHGINTFYFYQ